MTTITQPLDIPVNSTDCQIFIPSKGRSHLIFNNNAAATNNTNNNNNNNDHCTAALLARDNIPFCMVVEPQEERAYRQAFQSAASSSGGKRFPPNIVHFAVLPENNRGIAYSRNHILKYLAPRRSTPSKLIAAGIVRNTPSFNCRENFTHEVEEERSRLINCSTSTSTSSSNTNAKQSNNANNNNINKISRPLLPPTKCPWFIIVDDDISSFQRTEIPGKKMNKISAKELLEDLFERMKLVLAQEEEMNNNNNNNNVDVNNNNSSSEPVLPKNVGMFSIDYIQFAINALNKSIICNSYMNIFTVMNLDRLPQNASYRFKVREDYDMALNCIRDGFVNIRFSDLSYKVPSMGSVSGGMTQYYSLERSRDIRNQNRLFVATWGSEMVREVMKGGSSSSTRFDIKVNWSKLGKNLATASEFLKTHSKGIPPENPLVAEIPREIVESESEEETSVESESEDINKNNNKNIVAAAATTTKKSSKTKQQQQQQQQQTNKSKLPQRRQRTIDQEKSISSKTPIKQRKQEEKAEEKQQQQPPNKQNKTTDNSTTAAATAAKKSKWWAYERYRVVTDDVVTAGNLMRIERPTVGTDAVVIPADIKLPALMLGTIIDISWKRVKKVVPLTTPTQQQPQQENQNQNEKKDDDAAAQTTTTIVPTQVIWEKKVDFITFCPSERGRAITHTKDVFVYEAEKINQQSKDVDEYFSREGDGDEDDEEEQEE